MPRLLVAIAVSILFFVTACSKDDPNAIKIGAIASLSGPAAEQGKNWLQGAELAVSELQAQGVSVRLIVEDDATNNTKAVSAFQKLASSDGVSAIIGGTWDFLAHSLYPLALKHKKPFLTPTNPVELMDLEVLNNPYVFTNGLTIKAEKNAVRRIVRAKHIKRIAMIYPDLPWGASHAQMIQELAREEGLEIVHDSLFRYEDYPGIIKIDALKLSEIKPDAVYVTFDYNGIDILLNEMKKYQLESLLINTQHLDDALKLSKDASLYRNSFGIYPRVRDVNFASNFQKKFGKQPRVYSAEGYDALMFLIKVIQEGVNFETRQPRVIYQGVTSEHRLPEKGPSLSFNEAVPMTVKDSVLSEFYEQ